MKSREFSDAIVQLVMDSNKEWIIFGNQQLVMKESEWIKYHTQRVAEEKNEEWMLDDNHNPALNKLTTDDIALLSSLIAKHSPISLGLANIGLTDELVIALVNALQTITSIQTLYLPFNKISDTGAEAIARLLKRKDCTVKKLYLFSNQMSDRGVRCIANALLANDSLRELEIFCNPCTDKVLVDFRKALQENHKLERLVFFAPEDKIKLPDDISAILTRNELEHRRDVQTRRPSLFKNGSKQKSLNVVQAALPRTLTHPH